MPASDGQEAEGEVGLLHFACLLAFYRLSFGFLADEIFPPCYRRFTLVRARHERDPEVALAAGTERGAGSHQYSPFEGREGVGFVVAAVTFRYLNPKIEARVRGGPPETHPFEQALEEGALRGEDVVALPYVGVVAPSGGRGVLDEAWAGGADGGPEFLEGGYELGVAGDHRGAVAGYAAALAQGDEGQCTFLGYFEDRGRGSAGVNRSEERFSRNAAT